MNNYFVWKNKVRLSKTEFLNFLIFSKKSIKITSNSLEITKCYKNKSIPFLFFCLQNFLIFTFFYFRIIFGRTCYGSTVLVRSPVSPTSSDAVLDRTTRRAPRPLPGGEIATAARPLHRRWRSLGSFHGPDRSCALGSWAPPPTQPSPWMAPSDLCRTKDMFTKLVFTLILHWIVSPLKRRLSDGRSMKCSSQHPCSLCISRFYLILPPLAVLRDLECFVLTSLVFFIIFFVAWWLSFF